ncbi:MAG TPA: twin-arginine translocase subunit TatC [Sulfolobales archaeon]|nr:twin-arginine translocase subunit TatC [Sulfolobales archaeon]
MSQDREAPLQEHLEELRARLFRAMIALGIAVAVLIAPINLASMFSSEDSVVGFVANIIKNPGSAFLTNFTSGGSYESLTTLFIRYSREYILPPEARLIVGSVGSVFTAILQVALILALIATLPYIIYQVVAFVWPGLYEHEKRIVKKYLAISSIYIAGGMLAGFFITAYTVIRAGLYWGAAAGAEPWITLQGFISDLVSSIMGTVAIFIVPAVLLTLTELGVIDPDSDLFRNKKLIYALAWVIIAFFFPDLTTVILLLLFVAVYEPTFRYMKRIKKRRVSQQSG